MKYGFIGCGNMGGALAKALSKTTKDIMVSDFDGSRANALASELGITAAESNAKVALECERIFLGVKPQMMEEMLSGIKSQLEAKKPLLISMAAGLSVSKINKFVPDLPVIRIMPNTPVTVGQGVILYCFSGVGQDTVSDFVGDMRHGGNLYSVPENLIDAGCSVSGCGPAFMYMFASAVAKGGVACGLSENQAIEYAAATMAGAAQMLLKSGKTPAQLTEAVCSKGGSTIEGVNVLKNSDFEKIVTDCVKAAYKRNLELGK